MVIILCAITSIAMGIVTNRPFVLGPGLGSVAVYSVSMIIGEGISPAVASGVIFWEGLLFVIISFIGLRDIIVKLFLCIAMQRPTGTLSLKTKDCLCFCFDCA